MIEGLRAIGYDFSTAVADIIDNCVPAHATRVDVLYNGDCSEPYFVICDNGIGMSAVELEEAMDFGTRKNRDFSNTFDLGRFGLGLKTASLSQCKRFSVVTKRLGMIYGASWDVDQIVSNRDWTLHLLGKDEIENLPESDYLKNHESGTMVVWQKFDRFEETDPSRFSNAFSKRCNEAAEYCAMVFHRFYNTMAIYFNYRKIKKLDPFLEDFDNVSKMPESMVYFRGEKIRIRAYRMPEASNLTKEEKDLINGADTLASDQGFYIYRNNRLIFWGGWLRVEHKTVYTRLARIKIDIPASLDKEWFVDVKKSSVILPNSIKDKLWAPIKDALGQSKRAITYSGEREVTPRGQPVWIRKMLPNKQVTYQLNLDYPLFLCLFENLDSNNKKILYRYLKKITDYIPTSKMRDDVEEDLKVINAFNTQKNEESLMDEFLNDAKLIVSNSSDDGQIVSYVDLLLGLAEYEGLRNRRDEILVRLKNAN